MKTKTVVMVLCIMAGCCLAAPANALLYSHDDGTGSSGIGLTHDKNPNIIWANHFTVVPGGELITELQAALGAGDIGSLNGDSVTASLWSDPNGDGKPLDAVLLTSVAGVVGNWGTDVFNSYDIPDTAVSGSFFVAMTLLDRSTNFPQSSNPARSSGGVSGHGWLGEGNNLQEADFNEFLANMPAVFMVRAIGEPLTVPEPATVLLISFGLLGLTVLRKKLRK